jgi:surface protein
MNKIIKNTRETLRIPTKITNDNIKKYVKYYIESKENLPWDLKDKQIGDWDVSRVTDMSELFDSRTSFNEPLNNWNVSKVTNMNKMFNSCYKFNQELNKWDVSRVTNMGSMFMWCLNFNKPLNDWNVSSVTDMSSMFNSCRVFNQDLNQWDVSNVLDMSMMFKNTGEFNKPLNNWTINPEANTDGIFFRAGRMLETNKPTMQASQPVVDAQQVHKASGNVKYEVLNEFLSSKTGNPEIPSNLNYPKYINETINSLIRMSRIANPFSGESAVIKRTQLDELQRIMNERLNRFNYNNLSPAIRESIFYCLNYVKSQSRTFQKVYVASFIKDCVNAYEGAAGMTCVNGAVERIVLSLLPACAASQDNPDCSTIIPLITGFQDYILDWFKLHSPNHSTYVNEPFPSDSTGRRDNLKQYLLEKIKIPGKEDVVEDMIEENMKKWADPTNYDDDYFEYEDKNKGGRRTMKRRKGKRRQTMKKAKTVKTVKRRVSKKARKTMKRRK